MCVVRPACVNHSVRNVCVVGEKNREPVDESKMHQMGFLLVTEKSTESTFRIHFQIGGCWTEKNATVAQSGMPRQIGMCSKCVLDPNSLPVKGDVFGQNQSKACQSLITKIIRRMLVRMKMLS